MVTLTNEKDGVAHFIYSLIGERPKI
jgi:hypothetical protein